MKRNEASWDRIARVILGIALTVGGLTAVGGTTRIRLGGRWTRPPHHGSHGVVPGLRDLPHRHPQGRRRRHRSIQTRGTQHTMSTYTDRTEVLFFTTPHCSTCEAVMPVANAVAVRFGSAVRFTEVDSATDPVTPSAHRVRGVPTFIAIHQGSEVARAVGTRTPQQLTELFEAAVSGSGLRGQLSRTDRSLRLGVAAVFATGRRGHGHTGPVGVRRGCVPVRPVGSGGGLFHRACQNSLR